MPTIERTLEDVHVEIYAPTGGFIMGVSVFGDSFGGEALRFGTMRFGDLFSDAYESNQWVDYINDGTTISYNRGAVNDGASQTVQVGIGSSTFRNAANPIEDYKVRSGRNVRFRYLDEILFSGYLTKVPGRYVRKGTTYTKYFTVQIVDAVQRLAALKAYGAGGLTEPYETFEERIARLLDTYTGAVELPTGDAYPGYKLSATVYEASLASHLDLACNSVGASWYIDKLGQLRFTTTLTDYITAVFTDGSHTETVATPLNYYGLNIEYDPKNHINYLEIENKGIIEDPNTPGNEIDSTTKTVYADAYSIAGNGYLKADLKTNLYTEGAYTGSLQTRADEILTAYSTPAPLITKIFFNVQEDFSAAQLETLHLVEVWHETIKYTLRVAGISATINPKEWLLELDLVKDI
mgnify:CR=1 FL=1